MEVLDILEYAGKYGGSRTETGLPLRLLQKIFIRKDYYIGYLGCQTHN